jgi:hypothetical protein
MINNNCFSGENNDLEEENAETTNSQQPTEREIVLIYTGNLCDLKTITVSDLLNESMLKKLSANV